MMDKEIDWNKSACCSMHVSRGTHIAMVKLIFQKAVKTCFETKSISWDDVPSQAAQLARRIVGGVWNSGASPYVYCCANATELYVAFIEDKCIWLSRNTAGLYGKINIDGFIEIMG